MPKNKYPQFHSNLSTIYTIITSYITSIYQYLIENIMQFNDITKQNEIIFFDFETTGLNPYHNKIIDYAFLADDDSDENNNYIESLVNPETKFEKKITDITGIYPEELENIDNIDKHIPQIYSYINYNTTQFLHLSIPNSYLVAHNCHSFDQIFLRQNFKNYNKKMRKRTDIINHYNIDSWKYIDTLLLARKVMPNVHSYSLTNLAKHFEIKAGTHRALSDTICLKNVFNKLLELLAKETHISVNEYKNKPQMIIDYYM